MIEMMELLAMAVQVLVFSSVAILLCAQLIRAHGCTAFIFNNNRP